MNSKFRSLVICALFLLNACDKDDGAFLPDLSVSGETPNDALFTTWTLKAALDANASSCPGGLLSGSNAIEEEYRVVKNENGCTLEDQAENGDSLRNRELLFDDEITTCRAGGNTITLEWNRTSSVGNCKQTVQVTSRLNLEEDGATLKGTIGGIVTTSGNCPSSIPIGECKLKGALEGRQGRHAPASAGPLTPSTSGTVETPGEFRPAGSEEGHSGEAGVPATPPTAEGTPDAGAIPSGGSGTPAPGSGGPGGTPGALPSPPAPSVPPSPPSPPVPPPPPPTAISCPTGFHARGNDCVIFPDINLENAVRAELSIPAGTAVQPADLQRLARLFAESMRIEDLRGVEFCTGLRVVFLRYNNISDLSPLSNLPQLRLVWIGRNPVTDLTPLLSLPQLEDLSISQLNLPAPRILGRMRQLKNLDISYVSPQITDFSFLRPLTRLEALSIVRAGLTRLSELPRFQNLSQLQISSNPLTDFRNLTQFPALTRLYMSDVGLSDFDQLPLLPRLLELGVNGNPASNFGSLKRFTALRYLTLQHPQLSDISWIRQLPLLRAFGCSGSSLADISPLAGLDLDTVWLNSNNIQDLSPLLRVRGLTYVNIQHNPATDKNQRSFTTNYPIIQQLEQSNVRVLWEN